MTPAAARKAARGRRSGLTFARSAKGPGRPARRAGRWSAIVLRVWAEFWKDQIPMIAAGTTFYALLAIFPAIGAVVSLWGLFGDVEEAREALSRLSIILPSGVLAVVSDEMARVGATGSGGLTLAAAFGLVLSIWSASGAMSAIITGLNMAYEQQERRGFVSRTLIELSFTFGLIAFGLSAVLVLALPAELAHYLTADRQAILRVAGFGALFVAVLVGLSLLYHFGPSRHGSRWRWFTWGGSVAGIAWLASSVVFSLLVAHFGSYNHTYGALSAVVGFMTWIWISAMVILAGAEVNAALEDTAQPPQ